MQSMALLKKRVALTLGCLVLVRAGTLIPNPCYLDLWRAVHRIQPSGPGLGPLSGPTAKLSIFALGIMPYVSATIITLLLSALVPRLRRLREGSERNHLSFDRFILAMTALLALIQGLGIAIFMENLRPDLGISETAGWFTSRLAPMVIMALGTFVAVWLAQTITRQGLVNGVTLLILARLLDDLVPSLVAQYHRSAVTDHAFRDLAAVGLGLLILTAISVVFVQAQRRIPLVPRRATRGQEDQGVVYLPVRLNPTGIASASAAGSLLGLLVLVGRALFPGEPGREVLPFPITILCTCVIIVFASLLYGSWVFHGRGVFQRIESGGYRPADDPEAQSPEGIDRVQERLIWVGIPFLLVLGVFGLLASRYLDLEPGLVTLLGPTLVIATAFSLETVTRLRHLAARDSAEPWEEIMKTETDLDAEMARGTLSLAGIPAIVHSLRPSSMVGTFALWEVGRPLYPGLVIHQRLGGGHVSLLVPRSRCEDAAQVLSAGR